MLVSTRECMPLTVFGGIKAGMDAMGIDQVELELFHDNTLYSLTAGDSRLPVGCEAEIEAYAQHLADNHIKCCAILLHNNFAADDIDAEVDWVSWAVRVTAMLGANAIRIDAIMSKEMEWSLEQRVQRFADCMKRVLDATSDLEVGLGIENHGVQGNDPEFLDLVLGRVGSPRVGLNLDMANFYWRGYPLNRVHEIIRHFAPRVKHTHAKNINYPNFRSYVGLRGVFTLRSAFHPPVFSTTFRAVSGASAASVQACGVVSLGALSAGLCTCGGC